jgi:Sec-independent protein translocase protein TatA
LIEAAKEAGAIGAKKLPRAGKYLTAAERGLIEFLDALPEAEAKLEAEVEAKAKAKGESKAEAEAEVAAEAEARIGAEAA